MLLRILYYIKRWRIKFLSKWIYSREFRVSGKNLILNSPLNITGINHISVGDNVYIGYKCWLAAGEETGNRNPELLIGSGCHIGNFNHIYATDKILIEDNVLTADRVYITDNLHSYNDINIPVLNQPVVHKKSVVIGNGSWLGENVCVICANIGKHCVIGANSVVTKDIPDYTVAVGSPARVIKKYDFNIKKWVNV